MCAFFGLIETLIIKSRKARNCGLIGGRSNKGFRSDNTKAAKSGECG